jgi:hypothetical protein
VFRISLKRSSSMPPPCLMPELAEVGPTEPPALRPDKDETVRLEIGGALQVVGDKVRQGQRTGVR